MTTTTTTDTVRAASYLRVSSKLQSIDRQREENTAAAGRKGWDLTEYSDKVKASRFGRQAARENWGALLSALDTGQVDVLILNEPSRGDRKLTQWSMLLDACRDRGVLIHVTSDDYTYDVRIPRDWEHLANAGVASAAEVNKLSMRIKSGKAEAVREGRPQGLPYGVQRFYDPAKRKHNFLRDEPHPETGPVARRIVGQVAAGVAYSHIVAVLNRENVPPPSAARKVKAAQWNAGTVRRIAETSEYLASVGVVDEQTSLAARRRAREGKRTGERAGRQVYRYSSALACGVCGNPVDGVHKRWKGKGEHKSEDQGARYVCKRGHLSVLTEAVDAWIDELCVERLSRPDLIGLVRQTGNHKAEQYRAEAERHRQKIRDAVDSYNHDRIGIGELEDVRAFRKPKIEAAEKQARDAETPSALAGLPDEDRAVVRARWKSLTVSARKAAVRILAPDAVIRPAGRGRQVPIDERVILWPETPVSGRRQP